MLSEKYKKMVDKIEEDYEWFKYFGSEYRQVWENNFKNYPVLWDEINEDNIMGPLITVYPFGDIERFNKINIIYLLFDDLYYKYDIFKIVRMYNILMGFNSDKILDMHKKFFNERIKKKVWFREKNDDVEMLIHAMRKSDIIHKITYYELPDYYIEILDDDWK